MSEQVITDGNRQVSDKALMELKLRLDPFFKGRQEASGGGGGGITEVTSDDGSITVTDPTGPTVDLSASGFIQYDVDPQVGLFLDVETTGTAGQKFNSGVHEIGLNGGSTGANGTDGGQVFISSTVQILGRAANVSRSTTPAELDIGTSAGDDIEAYVKNLRVHMGTGGDGFAVFHGQTSGTTKILQARNAGGQDQFGVFDVGPVAQRSAPSSAQGIADALAAYGFLASAGTVDSSTVDGGTP